MTDEKAAWPDPTPEMLDDPRFDAVWQCIKTWDINVPEAYGGYCGATGNHVRAILDALSPLERAKPSASDLEAPTSPPTTFKLACGHIADGKTWP